MEIFQFWYSMCLYRFTKLSKWFSIFNFGAAIYFFRTSLHLPLIHIIIFITFFILFWIMLITLKVHSSDTGKRVKYRDESELLSLIKVKILWKYTYFQICTFLLYFCSVSCKTFFLIWLRLFSRYLNSLVLKFLFMQILFY